ncbi:MAG: AMP-binding protein [Planctomycetes bacterium]|nr:AMP-binding protein [Planctomycetota bacterium]
MANWINLGQIFPVNARKYPAHIAFMDRARRYTYPETNRRVNRLADALLALGLRKGDKISCLLENSIEICELYVAAAKTGLVLNPVNFRLAARDVAYIVGNADARAFVVHDRFTELVNSIRPELPQVEHYVVVGTPADGYTPYEEWLADRSEAEPDVRVEPADPWILLYTSGTTGRPKGVVRSHESYIAFYLINGCDFHFSPHDVVLTVMPLCHVNTTFFSFSVTYLGGTNYIHPAIGFDAREILEIIAREKITFISLIPTHYSLILAIPPEERTRHDLRSITKLLCSSAPARIEQKKGILECFRGVRLFEGYGSTEAGIVTTLLPENQLTRPGSIGKESAGTDFVRLLDEDGNDVPPGAIGELYSRGPMMFDEYYKMPEATAHGFRGDYFSAGDMARRDEDGYFYLVDRKHNMIITGGEHVYPSEVENVIARHPAVFDVAVIGVPHPKWTEAVNAVVILKEGAAAGAEEIIAFCRGELAAFKCPKSVAFVTADDMPRTASGKILHRVLRERFGGEAGAGEATA